MTILDRYVLRTILGSVLMVMFVFAVLGALFLFIGQQDDIGVGSYTALDAGTFVLLNLPLQIWELGPVTALIGALVGMGSLARSSELTVMRTSGFSVWRVARPALLAGLVLLGLQVALGEWLAPPMRQLANQQKTFGKVSNVNFAGRAGAWVRDGQRLVNVARQSADGEFGGIMVFELSADFRLRAIARAATATAAAASTWQLSRFAETRFDGKDVSSRRADQLSLRSSLSAELFGIAADAPNQLPTATVYRLIQHLRANGLDSREAEFAFWSRIARTAAIVFAVLLAVPFCFGSLRSSGRGGRTLIGLLIGVVFFLLQRMLESGAIVFDVKPLLLAWTPTALLAAAALFFIARTR